MSLLKVTLRKREIEDLLEVFTRAGGAPRSEHEDVEQHQKFKYAMGRNFELTRRVVDRIHKEIEAQRVYPPEWEAYRKQYEHIGEEYCQRDDSGQPDIDYSDPDRPKLKFENAETEKLYRDAIDQLREQYADTLAQMSEQEKKLDTVWDETASLELFSVPFAWIPERVHGGFIYALRHCIRDLPQDIDVESQDDPDYESVL